MFNDSPPSTTPRDFDRKLRFFDGWAPNYDVLLTTVVYQAIHIRLLSFLQLPDRPQVLDLGCGTGRLLDRLAREYPDLQGTGIDWSAEMVAQAQRRNAHPDRLSFQVANVNDLPFPADGFDAACCTISFLHYPDPERAIAQLDRVLKPGGRFYLADYLPFDFLGDRTHYPISPGGVRLYGRSPRERFAERVGWHCEGHRHLLGRIVLTVYRKPEPV